MKITKAADGTVTAEMTGAEAAEIQNCLLWANLDDEPATESLWEGLSDLDSNGE